jgi:hypothetical protein
MLAQQGQAIIVASQPCCFAYTARKHHEIEGHRRKSVLRVDMIV